MRFKKNKTNKTESLNQRCTESERNMLQTKANLYTEGNLSEYLIFAGLNYVAGGEDFEDEKAGE